MPPTKTTIASAAIAAIPKGGIFLYVRETSALCRVRQAILRLVVGCFVVSYPLLDFLLAVTVPSLGICEESNEYG